MGFAGGSVFEVVAGHDDERVEPSLRCGARVVGLEVAGHGRVEGDLDVIRPTGDLHWPSGRRCPRGSGSSNTPAVRTLSVRGGAAVAVDRVGHEPDETTEFVGGVVAGRGDQL